MSRKIEGSAAWVGHCELCNVRMERQRATMERPYRYTACGLSNVLLVGLTVSRCPRCGTEVPDKIPQMRQLHELIADHVANTPGRKLYSDEVRFLRKQAGLSAGRFAALLGVTAEYFSRVENGRVQSLGDAADRLVRVYSLAAKDGGSGRDLLLKLSDPLVQRSTERAATFELENEQWRSKAAA